MGHWEGNKRRKKLHVEENHQSGSDEGNCYIMKRFVIDIPHTGRWDGQIEEYMLDMMGETRIVCTILVLT
jgi:hypothetical protein